MTVRRMRGSGAEHISKRDTESRHTMADRELPSQQEHDG